MGKKTGFLEFYRTTPEKRTVQDRVSDYKEYIHLFKEEELHKQAARCMNCGVPFCNNGCPLGNIIPEFNDAVYSEKWEEAYNILISTNNFPEFTGRICPAPCESACVLGINQSPVTIEEIEKHIIEIAFEKGFVKPHKPNLRTGKKVAIIGSGPAGLAAAAQLNYAGHNVTVYERDDAAGGLLRYGIPDFKLEKWVVERRVKILVEEGINFRFHSNVGVNISVNEIIRSHDAVIIATGSTVPRNLAIPGRQLRGVHYAMHFLKQQNKRVGGIDPLAHSTIESNIFREHIIASNKNVVVIGGGDTGSDCVGTSNRQKAASVTQFELLPQPPEARTLAMPWPTYPMLLKTTTSHEEGVTRYWSINTKAFLGDEAGNLKALKVVDVEWELSLQGRPLQFKEQPHTEREIPCELAFLAMGFVHPEHDGVINELGLNLDDRGNIATAEGNFVTNHPKVFVAGDAHRGQSLVVWAIQEGRVCAKKVDDFLMEEKK